MDEQGERGFLPDFCAVRMVLAVVLGAVVLALVITLASARNLDEFWSGFSLVALYTLWIALAAAGLLCLLKRPLGRLGHLQAAVAAWLLLQGTGLAVAALTVRVLPLELVTGVDPRLLLVRTLGIGAILGALVLHYLYEQYRLRQQEQAENRARYLALQARIRPHFLFNSLNTVISLIPVDPDRARRILHDLSDLFRAAMGGNGGQSTLERELELVRQYLAVEQQRLGDRLRVEWALQSLPATARMPALLLQPLVENAVYHGIEPAPAGGEIRIFGSCRNGRLQLAVSNTLPPKPDQDRHQGNRMAMENVRRRLEALFGEEAGLRTGMVDGRWQVRIWMPVEACP